MHKWTGTRLLAAIFSLATFISSFSPAMAKDPVQVAAATSSLSISGARATQVTPTSAVIVWSTNKVADSWVVVSGQTSFGNSTTEKDHSITLTNLAPGTKYSIQIRSADRVKVAIKDLTFRTLDTLSIILPEIVDRTETSLTVKWKTIRRADSYVIVPGVGTFGDGNLTMSHEVEVTGLTSGSSYSAKVVSADAYMRVETTVTIATKTKRAVLADQILANRKIELRKDHSETPRDGASAYDNVRDTADDKPAKRSSGRDRKLVGKGGTTELSETVLRALLELARTYSFKVEELAGGKHGENSYHHLGKAFDISQIEGRRVDKYNPYQESFRQAAERLGLGFECLGPSNDVEHDDHIHCEPK